MEKIKSIVKDYKLYVFFLITMMFFGTFVKLNFAVDTYSVFTTSYMETVKIFLTSGRFLSAIWYAVIGVLGLGNTAKHTLSFVMAILFATLAQYKLNKLVEKSIKNDFLSIIVSTLIIINPFSIEYFMYLEKGVLLLAVFLAVCSVEQFVKYLEKKDNKQDNKYKKHLLFSAILMLFVTFSYQGILAIYISIAAIFVIKYSKNIKDFFINNIMMFLCYGIPAVINFLVIRIFFSNFRVNGSVNIAETFKKILEGRENMLYTYNILPKYFFINMLIIATVISLIIIIKTKKFKAIFGLLYVEILNQLITLVPFVMQNTESIWFVARSSYAGASLFGLIILFICVNIEKEEKLKSILFGTVCTIFMLVQVFYFEKIEIAHYNLNYTDKMNSLEIGNIIKEYEEETGTKVTKISIYLDKSHSYTYPEIFASGDINVSGFGPDWSDVVMINYYNGINLEKIEKDEEIQKSFSEKDWNNFDKDQVIIKGDTIHYCKF